MAVLRAAAVQFEHSPGDKQRNFAKIQAFTARAAEAQVRVLAFPECCLTGYWFLRKLSRDQLQGLAEPVPDGPSTRQLIDLASSSGITIGAGLVERDGEKLYNTYVVALPDGQVHRHRKIQAFENEHISAGSRYTV